MEVAFEEKAEVKVIRGPNSAVRLCRSLPAAEAAAPFSSKELVSRRSPPRSPSTNVSDRSHSRREVLSPSRTPVPVPRAADLNVEAALGPNAQYGLGVVGKAEGR